MLGRCIFLLKKALLNINYFIVLAPNARNFFSQRNSVFFQLYGIESFQIDTPEKSFCLGNWHLSLILKLRFHLNIDT